MLRMETADAIIEQLGLGPHPEGGFYRETFRHSERCDGRAHSTPIYYLLRAGEVSRWQSAHPLGAFALAGCTVAPGFEFSGFELAPANWSPR